VPTKVWEKKDITSLHLVSSSKRQRNNFLRTRDGLDLLAYQGCHGVVSRVCAIEIFGIASGLVDKFGGNRRNIVHTFAANVNIVVPI
jgi:hypothetical protein